jgi:opacity protein-like surface antigen
MKHTLLAAALVLAMAAPARADWLVVPYVGGVFGGAANAFTVSDADDEFEQRFTLGASVSFHPTRVLGFEVDYSAAPNFFQFTGGTGNFDLLDLDSSVQTLMGNVVLTWPLGGDAGRVRPYASAGLGTIRTQLRSESDVFDDITSNDTGYNFGAGVHFLAGGRFGLRLDVRYFRGFESIDDEDPIEDNPFFDQPFANEVFNFWRGTVGLTFRFGGSP